MATTVGADGSLQKHAPNDAEASLRVQVVLHQLCKCSQLDFLVQDGGGEKMFVIFSFISLRLE